MEPSDGFRSSRVRAARLLVALCLTATAALPRADADGRPIDQVVARGVVVSCPGIGQIWGSDLMTESVAELAELGVEWIAIHPYAGVRRDGSIRFTAAADTEYLDRAVEIIRAAGLDVFLKPHLAYWGSFGWRGEIEFGDDAVAWQRFFDGYDAFILDQAAFAERHSIPLFALGVELEKTFIHAERWNALLARVRQHYSGHVTYAANWSSLEDVTLWGQLDSIAVHAYFPVASGELPSRDAIAAGWDQRIADLRRLSQRYGKPILFAELGYNRSGVAASEPWDYSVRDTPEHRALRTRLMEVALEKVEQAEFIRGVFWWKWIPGPYAARSNFSMRDDEARSVLNRYWAERPIRGPQAPAGAPSTTGAGAARSKSASQTVP